MRACVFEDREQSAALPNPLPGSLIRDGGTTTVPLRSRVQQVRLWGKYAFFTVHLSSFNHLPLVALW